MDQERRCDDGVVLFRRGRESKGDCARLAILSSRPIYGGGILVRIFRILPAQ